MISTHLWLQSTVSIGQRARAAVCTRGDPRDGDIAKVTAPSPMNKSWWTNDYRNAYVTCFISAAARGAVWPAADFDLPIRAPDNVESSQAVATLAVSRRLQSTLTLRAVRTLLSPYGIRERPRQYYGESAVYKL
ncbi:hypothetical protein ACJJTC_014669 [Scirpophaga incertulas]